MTKREMMEMVIAGNITDEVIKFAESEIVKMDAKNEKRRATVSKKAQENEPIKVAIADFLKGCDEPITASAIGAEVGISVQKASALCRQMVEGGTLTAVEVKVKGKGKQKGYSVCQLLENKGRAIRPSFFGN